MGSMSAIHTGAVPVITATVDVATRHLISVFTYFYIGYTIVFALLGLLCLLVYMPRESRFSGYRKSRIMLGAAFLLMMTYCLCRIAAPLPDGSYFNHWLMMAVSLVFSWMNYTSFLFLIDASYSVRRSFLIDGVAPMALMVALGLLGQYMTGQQTLLGHLLNLVFLAKCVRMFYVSEREWRKVDRELANYDDGTLSIRWMRSLLWLTFLLSVCTWASSYVPAIHRAYDIAAPCVYVYMVFKLINYVPRRIDAMRMEGSSAEPAAEQTPPPPSVSLKDSGLRDKLEPRIERWVSAKGYCAPDLSIKDVASALGTNHNYLSQYLNSCLGITFQVWLNTLRIEESKHILTDEPHASIEEVGTRVGIIQSYNYSRWFKTVTGTTPRKYRTESLYPKRNSPNDV